MTQKPKEGAGARPRARRRRRSFGGFGRAADDDFDRRHQDDRRSGDDLAERMAEAALEQLTGGYDGDFEQNDLQVDEELGGPFVQTGPEDEMSYEDAGWPQETEVSATPRLFGDGGSSRPDE
ncbi:MAG: hypothetical protein ACFCGT_04150 [Sandaracinaceae bacterium]